MFRPASFKGSTVKKSFRLKKNDDIIAAILTHLKSGPVESSIRNRTITKTFENLRRKEQIDIGNGIGIKVEYESKRLSPYHLKTILRKSMRKKG